jgi:hypothetical protein
MIRIAIDEQENFTPEVLTELGDGLRQVKGVCLMAIDGAGADAEAEQYYLLALSSLEQSERFCRIAALKQSHALALTRH